MQVLLDFEGGNFAQQCDHEVEHKKLHLVAAQLDEAVASFHPQAFGAQAVVNQPDQFFGVLLILVGFQEGDLESLAQRASRQGME